MLQFAILLLQVTRQIILYMEKSRLIKEGERRQIERELEAVAKAAAISKKINTNVGKMTDEEIDAALRGDYRD